MTCIEKFADYFDNVECYEKYNNEYQQLLKIPNKKLTPDQLERKNWLILKRKANKTELTAIILMFNKMLSLRANDQYTEANLKQRFQDHKTYTLSVQQLNLVVGKKIRCPNMAEDLSENTVKFILWNHEHDFSVRWAKGLVKVSGDLVSSMYGPATPIEVKAFASKGPSQFGPKKAFGILYFLDMRGWLKNHIICWRVKLSSNSKDFKSIDVNQYQTMEDQCDETRRPRIGWDKLYPQIQEHCEKNYDGTFEGIFVSSSDVSKEHVKKECL